MLVTLGFVQAVIAHTLLIEEREAQTKLAVIPDFPMAFPRQFVGELLDAIGFAIADEHTPAVTQAAAPETTVTPIRAHDPEYCTRAGMALKAMGPRRGRDLADALDRIDRPVPLQVLVDVVGALGVKSLIYRLKDLIDRLETRSSASGDGGAPDLMQP